LPGAKKKRESCEKQRHHLEENRKDYSRAHVWRESLREKVSNHVRGKKGQGPRIFRGFRNWSRVVCNPHVKGKKYKKALKTTIYLISGKDRKKRRKKSVVPLGEYWHAFT